MLHLVPEPVAAPTADELDVQALLNRPAHCDCGKPIEGPDAVPDEDHDYGCLFRYMTSIAH